jgi:phosphatidate cytidylyltransferase
MIETTASKRRSDLAVRAGTGAVAIAVALTCLWVGGLAWAVLVGAAGLLMLAEWAGLMRATPRQIATALLLFVAWLVPAAFAYTYQRETLLALGGDGYGERASMLVGVIPLMLVALAAGLIGRSLRLAFGFLYVGLPVASLLLLRHVDGAPGKEEGFGFFLTLWVLATVWATDIGAYFFGRAIGGPRLAPALSPNKTWAGLGGGIAGSALVTMLAVPGLGLAAPLPAAAIVGAGVAVLAQAGDLFESWLKRRAGVKDSGRLLPGHGGALDRLDGVVPVATAVATLVAVMGG